MKGEDRRNPAQKATMIWVRNASVGAIKTKDPTGLIKTGKILGTNLKTRQEAMMKNMTDFMIRFRSSSKCSKNVSFFRMPY